MASNPLRAPLTTMILLCMAAPSYAISIAPQIAGTYLNGDGANSSWVQVDSEWRGNIYGDESWGTGIWGLSDHAQVMSLSNNDPAVVKSLTTRVDQINFSDQDFINVAGSTWGSTQLAPIFDNHAGENQDNWASSFWGYVAITTPGAYNFGVLYDDGFRFSLFGANGSSQSILQDGLNPRDRLGFSDNLILTTGLYAYQLDAYDRLQVGAVQLSWYTPGANNWAVVPKENLFTSPVPEPALPLLMLAGLAAIGLRVRRFAHS